MGHLQAEAPPGWGCRRGEERRHSSRSSEARNKGRIPPPSTCRSIQALIAWRKPTSMGEGRLRYRVYGFEC